MKKSIADSRRTSSAGLPVRKRGFIYELRKNYALFLMLIPTFIYFLLNSYMPMVGIYFAFTRYNFRDGLFGSPFVGLENFRFLYKSGKLLNLTFNTVTYNLAFILITNMLQVMLAVILSRLSSKLFKRVSQSVIFLPYFVSYVILNVIVYNVFNYEMGFLNSLRTGLGLERYNAYGNPEIWRLLMIIFYIWKNLGYGMVVYLATITGISNDLYEAAEIDGATVMQEIRYITLPLLFPTFVILLMFALGRIMRGQFDLFYQVIGNNGLLYNTTDILDTFVFRTLKQDFDVGMSTAAGLFQSVVGFVIIVTVNGLIRRKDESYALF